LVFSHKLGVDRFSEYHLTALLQLVKVVSWKFHPLSVVLSKFVDVVRSHFDVAVRRRRAASADVLHVDVDGQIVDVDRLFVGEDGHL